MVFTFNRQLMLIFANNAQRLFECYYTLQWWSSTRRFLYVVTGVIGRTGYNVVRAVSAINNLYLEFVIEN